MIEICNNLLQLFETIPTRASELGDYINKDFLYKLPVTFYKAQRYPLLNNYIYHSYENFYCNLAYYVSNILDKNIREKIKRDGSEDIIHSPVDRLVRINWSEILLTFF